MNSEMFSFSVVCLIVLMLGGVTSSTVIQMSKERSAATVLCIAIGLTPLFLFALFVLALPPIEAPMGAIQPLFRVIIAVMLGVSAFGAGMVVQAVALHVLHYHSQGKPKEPSTPT